LAQSLLSTVPTGFVVRANLRSIFVCIAAAAVTAVLYSRQARAEGWMVDGVVAVGTGLEGGDPGAGDLEWARARTRVIGGADLRSDEAEREALGFRGFAEIEKRGSLGAEARYSRFIGRAVAGSVFLTGTIAPETLFGGGFAGTFMIPFSPRFALALEPAFAVLPLGSDVPDDSILLWATLSLGVRVGL
jgi:hypothetical protein